jgi:LacI family transcriptional regulator
VVRSTRPVSESTRAQVLRAIEELGYRPNAVASALKRGASRTIGFVFTDLLNPYFAMLALAVERRGREAGFAVLLANTAGSPYLESAQVRALVEQRVEGVVIPSMSADFNIAAELLDHGIPTVCVGFSNSDSRLGCVECDDEAAMADIAEHLVSLGHERIAFLRSAIHDHTIERRPTALAAELRSRGLEVVGLDERPTAICCTNDVTAIELMRYVLRGGWKVPEDLSIVGFDDIDIAAHPRIDLTTIRTDAEETGDVAIDLLLKAIGESRHVSDRVRLPASLVRRGSTGRAVETVGIKRLSLESFRADAETARATPMGRASRGAERAEASTP